MDIIKETTHTNSYKNTLLLEKCGQYYFIRHKWMNSNEHDISGSIEEVKAKLKKSINEIRRNIREHQAQGLFSLLKIEVLERNMYVEMYDFINEMGK